MARLMPRWLPEAIVLALLATCLAYPLFRDEPKGIPKQAAKSFVERCALQPDAAWSLAQEECLRLRRDGNNDTPGPERHFLVTPDGTYFFPAGQVQSGRRLRWARYTEGYYVNPLDGRATHRTLDCRQMQDGWLSLPQP
jgi:hypothetical protein